MARIQIEERAWSDPRLIKLMVKLNIDQAYAIGLLQLLALQPGPGMLGRV